MAKVKLGEVAREYKSTVKEAADLPNVGLEHLIPREIELTQWSEDSDNTFTKGFKKGQMLFGRRRAYLKKAAVAPFDGICSGDITVIEAIPEKILPELLPFVIQNDRLFDYAVEKSAGSLSPRVKWEHLKNYEFELPEIGQQKELVDLLWAMTRAKKAYQDLLRQTDELVKSQFIEMFGDARNGEEKYPLRSLKDICSVIQDGEHATVKRVDEGHLFISARNIKTDHQIVLDTVTYVNDENFAKIRKRFAPQKGDILLTCAGTIGNSAIVPDLLPFVADRGLTMLRPDESMVLSEYLHACIASDYVQEQMRQGTHATALAHLYLNKINALKVVVPPVGVQEEFAGFLQQSDKSKFVAYQSTVSNLYSHIIQILQINGGHEYAE